MPAHFLTRLGRLPLGKVFRSVVLPLLLLVAQHGALLHEVSHFAARETQENTDRHHPQWGHCDLCMAFAQIDSAAAPDAAAARLLAGLVFHQAAAMAIADPTAESPAQRNRGPPTFL